MTHDPPQHIRSSQGPLNRAGFAGYDVWADVFQLADGEAFWRDIRQAIIEHAAIVVVAVSCNSYRKDGVLAQLRRVRLP